MNSDIGLSTNKSYETEEYLGPLPNGIEIAVTSDGKRFFVNHITKITSWIDPRTKNKRKHDIRKVKAGELPYGWEEAYDPLCGYYYIDHNTQSNYFDPPWDRKVQQHNEMLRQRLLASEAKAIQDQHKQKKDTERQKVMNLDKELLMLDAQGKSQIKSPLSTTEDESSAKEIIQIELAELTVLLEQLRASNDNLKSLNSEQHESTKSINNQIADLKPLIEKQSIQTIALEKYISQVRSEVLSLVQHKAAVDNRADFNSMKRRGLVSDRFQLQMKMELELLALKKRLQKEKRNPKSSPKLETPTNDSVSKLSSEGVVVPEWVRNLNDFAAKSKTLRTKIGKQAKQNPDGLSFREKMTFFAASAIEKQLPST